MDDNATVYDLDRQLERSVEWVKFAETKNAVAVGLLGAAFVETCKPCVLTSACEVVLVVSLALQLILLICSFIPRFSSPLCLKHNKAELNFHYYGDISSVFLDEFRTKLKRRIRILDIMIASYRLSRKRIRNPEKLHIVCRKQENFSINDVFGIE
jgi:hypothetical protein